MQNYCMNCMMPLGEQDRICPHCGYSGDGAVVLHQLCPGTLLKGRYLVGNMIGQGGFGITYIGRDTTLDMKIAVKEYYPTGYVNRNALVSPDITITDKKQLTFIEDGKSKFLQEARTLAKFNENASVVNIHNFFEENQTAYIIMEYLDGQDLRRCLKQSLFATEQIFELMVPIFDALEQIHGENMIHRDISPDNIMMLKNGALKLMDFGATRQVNFSDQKSVSVVLKAGFAPEEQYRSKGVQGPWTDIYALCATIYKCITGITPDDSLQRSSKDEIQWPSELGIPITARQEAMLKKGMAIKQQDRFQSIGEMKSALEGNPDFSVQSIDLHTEDKLEDDHTVYHPHGGQKDSGKEDATQRHLHGGQKKEQSTDEEDITQYQPHVSRRAEQPVGRKGDAKGGILLSELRETPEAIASGSGGKRKLVIAGICAAAVLAVAITAATLRGGNSPAQETEPPGTQSGEVTADPVAELDDALMYHITLTMDDKMTVRQLNETLPILKERLDVFTGGDPYEMAVEEDSIYLRLPQKAFGQVEIEQAMKCYITRAINLYIFDRESANLDGYLSMKKEALNRSDLKSVTLMEGTIDGVDATQAGINTPTYQYIVVTLTDQCAQRYSQEIAEWGENLAFGQDLDYTNFYHHSTFPAGDGKTFYILNKDMGGNFSELVVYNLTHDPLPHSFGVVIDLNDTVKWQSPEDALAAGENQREASELTGDTVTFLIRHSKKELTAGEQLDLETELKTRLDLLGQPYAYGHVEDEKYFVLAVKTGPEHMGKPIIKLIAHSGVLTLQTNLVEMTANCESLSWEKEADGTYRVTLRVNSSSYSGDMDKLSKLSGWMAEQGGGTLSLTDSVGVPLLSTDINRRIEDGTVTFRHLCFDGSGDGANITDKDIWILRLMDRAWSNTQSTKNLSVGDIQMNLGNRAVTPVESRYGVSHSQKAKDITDTVLSVVPGATVTVQDYEVWVALDLEVNEDLPETAAAAAREIYKAFEFESSIYRFLNIYLINEEGSERGRIFFSKRNVNIFSSTESVTDGYIYVAGIFANGRLDRYKDVFKNIVETDPFYVGLTVKELTSWIFEP